MSSMVDAIRPYWLPGINDVSGIVEKGLAGWICEREFQVYQNPQPDQFVLTVSEPSKLVQAFAADVSRPALASIETMNQVPRTDLLPKSAGWLIIRSYYASYFAAHAILRMLGVSFAQITKSEIDAINRVAELYVQASALVKAGYFLCQYQAGAGRIVCSRDVGTGGPHEMFWVAFVKQMRTLSDELSKSKTGSISNNKFASAKLTELCDSLCRPPSVNGSWLSHIRNEVNYKQRFQVWFPYQETRGYYDRLFQGCEFWEADAGSILLNPQGDHVLRTFQLCCSFIANLCRGIVMDMASRCSSGKSFHHFGAIGLMHFVEQRRPQHKRSRWELVEGVGVGTRSPAR